MEQKVAVVIPALNPDEKLLETLDELCAVWDGPIVVVDDGSGGGPVFEQAKRMNCTVLTHCVNLGKGRALKTAFNYCACTWPQLVGCVTADADGQHAVDDICRCAKELLKNPDSLVLGCRDFSGADVPGKSRWGNRISCIAMAEICGVKVSDTQTGLRAIPMAFMKHLLLTPGERYEFETNMLLETRVLQMNIREIAIRTIYLEGNRRSHFRPLQDSLRIFRLFFKFLLASLSSSLLDLALFALLIWLLAPWAGMWYIAVATVLARVLSALFNYVLNSRAVFQRHMGRRTAARYFTLCAVQMAASAVVVSMVCLAMPWPELAVKVCVDIVLFLVGFRIQRHWIFT